MNLPRSSRIIAYPLLVTAAALTACNKAPQGGGPGAHGGMPAMPPPEVAIVTVQPQTVPVHFEYAAQVAGSREAEIRAQVTGILLKRNYADGESVKAGQTLFSIDPAPYQVAVASAEAQLASAQARLSQAERNLARIKPLWDSKVVAQRDYDDAVSAQQIAQADIKTAQAQVKQALLVAADAGAAAGSGAFARGGLCGPPGKAAGRGGAAADRVPAARAAATAPAGPAAE